MAVEQALQGFRETESGDSFSLQNPRLLKVELADVTIQAKLGTMVAYQGEVKFERAGTGGMARLMKKVATGEGVDLMKVSGTGEVFLAFHAQEVHLVKLADDKITVNSSNLLAFEAGIDWDIRKVEGASGVLAGGLFNLELAGRAGSRCSPTVRRCCSTLSGEPTFADPQAAITWSSGVKTAVKTDVNLKTLIGRASGETLQMQFSGDGWVLSSRPRGCRWPRAGAAAGSGTCSAVRVAATSRQKASTRAFHSSGTSWKGWWASSCHHLEAGARDRLGDATGRARGQDRCRDSPASTRVGAAISRQAVRRVVGEEGVELALERPRATAGAGRPAPPR